MHPSELSIISPRTNKFWPGRTRAPLTERQHTRCLGGCSRLLCCRECRSRARPCGAATRPLRYLPAASSPGTPFFPVLQWWQSRIDVSTGFILTVPRVLPPTSTNRAQGLIFILMVFTLILWLKNKGG